MKHRYSALIAIGAALLSTAGIQAQTQIGYTTGNMGRSTVFHFGNSRLQGMAIRLSHEKLQPLAGRTITAIYTAFGSANAVADKTATLFIAPSLYDESYLEQDYVIGQANRWCTIDLDQTYTITGEEEELVVGYMLEANSDNIPEALQADHKNDLRNCSFAWNGKGWTDLYGTGFGSANIRLVLDADVDFTDAMLSEVDFAERYYLAGQGYEHKTHIYNFGSEPITSLDVTVTMGEQQQTVTYDGLSVEQHGVFEFELPTLASATDGTTGIEVSVRANHSDEADVADNSFQGSAYFYPANMERNLLVEEFTGTSCPNCPNGQTTLQKAVEQSGLPCVEIMHHAGYAPDFYSTDADWDYTIYYGTPSTFAPAAMIDRVVNPEVSTVPVINVGLQYCLSTLEYAASRQPYVSLSLESAYNESTRQVDVKLGILAHNDLPGPTLFNAFLIQDGLVGYQSNGGTDYVHNGVMRSVLTNNSWGMLLPSDFGRGQQYEWTTSFELPEAIKSDFWTKALLSEAKYSEEMVTFATVPSDMRIVVYVANYSVSDINQNMVHNSIEVPLVNGSCTQAAYSHTEALEAVDADRHPSASGIYDLTGRQLDGAASLPAGFYIIDGHKAIIR